MANLEKFRQYHHSATVKVSENTRTLAISAIAIIWLFKTEKNGIYTMPKDLIIPVAVVMIALALDYIQYIYSSIVWHKLFRAGEAKLDRKEIDENSEIYVKPWVNTIAYVFFYLKSLVLIIAYYKLISYLCSAIKLS